MNFKKFILKTPILFLVFNRLDTTKQVFEEIRKAKPNQLFIAADGPRNDEEKKKTNAVRKYVISNIDWSCKVKKLFRRKNLGCKHAVAGAIDWFFENVEQGIILEDDCLPSQSFFRFCQKLLEKYKDDEKIISIAGYNPLGKVKLKESYLFSKYFYCWGWATWRRAWEKRDLEMENVKQGLKRLFFFEKVLYKRRFDDNLKGKTNSWAICFLLTHLINKGLCIVPSINLIENIGFLISSTHTKKNKWDKKYLYHKANEINFPLKYPKEVKLSKKFDNQYVKQDIKRGLLKKIILKLLL